MSKMSKMSKIIKTLKKPMYILIYLNNRGIHILSDKQYLRLRYKIEFGEKLNLKKPTTLNEKLQWIKIYDRKKLYEKLVDKYEVKKYVKKVIGEEYIVPTLGIYEKFEEINFEKLPQRFVIKTTHFGGGEGVVIVKDKDTLDIRKTKKIINSTLRKNLFYSGREWPYKNIKPRIIIEEYLENKDGVLNDFKIQTFNGKIAYSFVCTDRATGNVKFTFFDKNKKFINVTQCGQPNDPKNAKLPKNYKKYVELAEKLAKNTTESRIDFYDVDGKIYFSEITFFDSSGFGKFDPEKYDKLFGDMLKLDELKTT